LTQTSYYVLGGYCCCCCCFSTGVWRKSFLVAFRSIHTWYIHVALAARPRLCACFRAAANGCYVWAPPLKLKSEKSALHAPYPRHSRAFISLPHLRVTCSVSPMGAEAKLNGTSNCMHVLYPLLHARPPFSLSKYYLQDIPNSFLQAVSPIALALHPCYACLPLVSLCHGTTTAVLCRERVVAAGGVMPLKCL
jgi:hypothetical protein